MPDALQVKRILRALVAAALVATTALATTGSGAQAGETSYPTTGERVSFTISSFNVLGSTHTEPGARLARMGSGTYRIGLAVRLLDKHGVDVVGFQELQMDQWEEFERITAERYDTWPGGLSRRIVQNSIGWSTESWSFVSGELVKIPYFDGVEWDMPVVLLQHTVTGQLAYFANFHNPATNRNHRNSTPFRREAERREVEIANRLHATGLPVFITGDMNERETYFCTMAGGAPMKAANGGSFRDGICTPPPKPMPVNWIFGAKKRGSFSNYVRDDSRLVNRITDHYVVRADVRMPAPPAEEPVEEPTP